MGFIRGSLLVIAGVFLFLSLLIGNIFLILNLSSDYSTIKPKLVFAVKELFKNEKINLAKEVTNNFEYINLQCQKNSEFIYEDSSLNYIFNIPCNITPQDPESILNYGINNFIEQAYYKNYSCDFFECIKNLESLEAPFFLVSKKAHDYWKEKFYLSLIISFILIFLTFILVEKKENFFFVNGMLLIVASIPFMKLNWILSFLSIGPILLFLKIIFSYSHSIFLIGFISGIIFLGTGLILKFFRWGSFLSKKLEENEDALNSEKITKSKKIIRKISEKSGK